MTADTTQKRSKRNQQGYESKNNNYNNNKMSTTYSSVGGTAVKRIRVPHPNDVLSGRGGGINSHVGNVRFREWVAVRKNDYTLAPSKADKARVAKEVIDLVEHQTPPGRFLQKDPTAVGGAGWWVEIDEERVMAKTSQALREGAPQIRALHRDELDERKSNYDRRRKADAKPESSGKNNKRSLEEMRSAASSPATTTPVSNSISRMHEQAVNELRANAEAAREAKQVRLEYGGNVVLPSEETPPLTSTKIEDNDAMVLPPPLDLDCVPAPHKNMKRTHSLALSDLGNTDDWCATDFVNPFEDEYEAQEFSWTPPSPRPGILRESSTSNNSDMGGIGALMRSDSSRSNTSSSNHNTSNNGVRPKNTVANMSSRSLSSVLSDLPDAIPSRHISETSDFMEGIKLIYDALHPDGDEEVISTCALPYRGSAFRTSSLRRNTNGLSIRGADGRQ